MPPPLPPQLDWRERGLFPCRDQVPGNTCTAFAVCAVLADRLRITKPDVARPLSPGHLHICLAGLDPDSGLDPLAAIEILQGNAVAAATAGDYPYDPARCATAVGLVRVGAYRELWSESDAKRALQSGPILGVMSLLDDFWDNYPGGIFQTTEQSQKVHSIEIVGYDDPEECWLVRNSRGPNWGEASGCARIGYGHCGLLTDDGHRAYELTPVLVG